ncbi:MAG: hypothetical protein L6R37_004599 [Teloschistes peruensis]|nr:MAG: hypothetical protein L6R37_004599 [Teloschistes peruensis]
MPRGTRSAKVPLADGLQKTPSRGSNRHRRPSKRRLEQEQELQEDDSQDNDSSLTPRGSSTPPDEPGNTKGPREDIVMRPLTAIKQLRRRNRKDGEEKEAKFKERDRYHPITEQARKIRNT